VKPQRRVTQAEVMRRFTQPETPTVDTEYAASARAIYNQELQALLYKTWQEPAADQVPNRALTVRITYVLERSGAILSTRIVGPSGNGAMDQSASRLQAALSRFAPVPAELEAPFTFTVTLGLD